jgi:hypothetical protein
MFHAAADDKAVACSGFEHFFACPNREMAGDYVRHLIVPMTMRRPDPAFFHAVFGKEEFVVEGSYKPGQAGLRAAGPHFTGGREDYIRRFW